VLVEAVVTKGAIEGLDEGILIGLTGLDMIEVYLAPLSPEVKGLASELRPIIAGDGTWGSNRVAEDIEQLNHGLPSDGGIDMECQALAGAIINQGKAAEASPSGKLVMDEVYGPPLIRTSCHRHGNTNQGR
jgi:hypothetical protein